MQWLWTWHKKADVALVHQRGIRGAFLGETGGMCISKGVFPSAEGWLEGHQRKSIRGGASPSGRGKNPGVTQWGSDSTTTALAKATTGMTSFQTGTIMVTTVDDASPGIVSGRINLATKLKCFHGRQRLPLNVMCRYLCRLENLNNIIFSSPKV